MSKVIPTEYRNVFVGVGYSIYIENGIALELSYTDIPTQKQFYQEGHFQKEYGFLWRTEERTSNCRIFRMRW